MTDSPACPLRTDLLQPLKLTDTSVGGFFKSDPEDFCVDEIPLYEPIGTGEHQFLRVQKRNIAHLEMVKAIAAEANVSRDAVKTAGIKDKVALTTQWVSVQTENDFQPGVLCDGVTILDVSRHENGLKIGHLSGNRFRILVRRCRSEAETLANAAIDTLSNRFANTFGLQRFGFDFRTLRDGLALLQKDFSTGRRPKGFAARLSLAAAQSYALNATAHHRVRRGVWNTVQTGDVLGFPTSGAVFLAEDTAAEQRRFDRGETCLTGPLHGARCKAPAHAAEELERDVLNELGLSPSLFRPWKRLIRGERRTLTMSPQWDHISQEGDQLKLSFTLRPGCYATNVLFELGVQEALRDDQHLDVDQK